MTTLNFKFFEKTELITALKREFPNFKIQNTFGNLQVRTSGFTATGNVHLIVNDKKGTITTKTNYDSAFLFFFIAIPLGIYIYSKKDKQVKMEREVVDALNKILEPISISA